MKQVLTVKGVKAAGRRAYKARKLTAQHRNPDKRGCYNKMDSCRCIIGAGLSKATLKKMDGCWVTASVTTLRDNGFVTFDKRIIPSLTAIQGAHDVWARKSSRYGAKSKTALKRRAAFLTLIAA